MDAIAAIAAIGALTGIIALCISIFTLRDNRRKTKIMEEQLRITRKENEKKRRYTELSKDTAGLSATIRQDCEYSLIEDLFLLHQKILTHLHDTHIEALRLTIEPEKLEVGRSKNVDNTGALELALRDLAPNEGAGGSLHIRSTPPIFDEPHESLLVGGALCIPPDIWRGCQKLASCRDILDALDPNILRDLDESAERIVSATFESLMSRHSVEFMSTDKSDQIYERLEQAFEARSLKKEKERLVTELCVRLDNISKEMVSKL